MQQSCEIPSILGCANGESKLCRRMTFNRQVRLNTDGVSEVVEISYHVQKNSIWLECGCSSTYAGLYNSPGSHRARVEWRMQIRRWRIKLAGKLDVILAATL